jgi:hypothetical protein
MSETLLFLYQVWNDQVSAGCKLDLENTRKRQYCASFVKSYLEIYLETFKVRKQTIPLVARKVAGGTRAVGHETSRVI